MDCGEADVAGPHGASPVLFEMIQKCADQCRIEIREVESGRSNTVL